MLKNFLGFIAAALIGFAFVPVLASAQSVYGPNLWMLRANTLTPVLGSWAISAYASSTIGNGTQVGGLTVSGGATTTANFVVGTTTGSSNASLSRAYIVGGSTNSSDFPLYVTNSVGSSILRVRDDSRVGIGTNASPGSTLSVLGNAIIGSTVVGFSGPTNGLAIQTALNIGTTSSLGTSQTLAELWINSPFNSSIPALLISTSTSATATSTAFTIDQNGKTGIATTTFNGQFGIGPMTGNGSSTVAGGKIQWDGYDAGGTHRCFFFAAGGSLTSSAGACNL